MIYPTQSEWQPIMQELLAEAEAFGLKYGTCDRLRVGCILLDSSGHIIAKAANTAVNDLPTCDAEGHLMIDGHCQRTVHAEQNAVAMVAIKRKSPFHGTAIISHAPCLHCAKLLISCGISNIYYKNDYANIISKELLEHLSEKTGVYIGKTD